jgi:SAM-dependent methyltransferase
MEGDTLKTSEGRRPEEWHYQWSAFRDEEDALLRAWLSPLTFDSFRGRDVLECGCGGGHHTAMLAPYAKTITAVDLNTVDIARDRCSGFDNLFFQPADLMTLDLGRQFEIVMCIGVIHHTDDPDVVFERLYRHCKPGGTVVVWTYSAEGNALVRYGVEPLRRGLLAGLSRPLVQRLAALITVFMYPIVHTVYRLPFLQWLPYYDYFRSFRTLSFRRNMLNIFDKLNAPQTRFTTYAKCREWFNAQRFDAASISIRHHDGVSYSLSGIKISV